MDKSRFHVQMQSRKTLLDSNPPIVSVFQLIGAFAGYARVFTCMITCDAPSIYQFVVATPSVLHSGQQGLSLGEPISAPGDILLSVTATVKRMIVF